MTPAARAQLLWSVARGREVYAVLDGARDPAIHTLVRAADLDASCLYAGDLAPALREVAPYLVRITPDAALAETLVSTAWGRAWGIWLTTAVPFDDLRRHLRRFLRVRDEAGRGMLFRYYDPLVLAAFLPTCSPAQLAELFGPIDRFLVETAPDPAITELWLDAGVLRTALNDAPIAGGSTDAQPGSGS